jgi:AcrR family transcriptional regulator
MLQLAVTGQRGGPSSADVYAGRYRDRDSGVGALRCTPPGASGQPQAADGGDAEPPDVTRILAAAWSVLARSRFRSLKIRQVLVASNTSASHFYRHFPSKAHLLFALLREEAQRAERVLTEQLVGADDAPARLRVWLGFHVRAIYDETRIVRVRLFRDPALLEELPDEVSNVQRILHTQLLAIIHQGMEEGTLRSADPVADAEVVQNVVRGLIDDGLAGRFSGTEEQALDRLHGFVLRALHCDAPHPVGSAATPTAPLHLAPAD